MMLLFEGTENMPPGHLFILILRYFVCVEVEAFKRAQNVPPGHLFIEI